ncbi:flavin-containing monooxygenase [Rhodothermus profundi]|uniref:Predicted flavoprotein CzcO associated with the cation diffusion facilitator CzcD n=1 Tax=Rhodothermus profundi TaxID=633813 RepID=A0A1M6XV98_9BACT|nr:NAD(P)-binding domain-containing protein [Rhodothermus profundi]SHL09907.1 Predicted flavoprotein CzcO associated with the cation diffusion facilitator CzcD [Rhodothermus profundi]
MKACIIGAGPSGLVTAKVLHQRGLPFDCFEKGSDIGGLWRYANDSGLSPAYASLHVNTSKTRTAFSDFPMPDDYPDFPSHAQMLAYFERYVEHFGFRHTITFRTEVQRVVPVGDGTYEVTVRHRDTNATRTERYGAVIVATGHHWCPNWPEVPGAFDGEVMHARDYRTPEVLKDKRVLVVGAGNSACDIACEAVHHARAVYLSTRRGAHVIPKYLLGRPLDLWLTPLTARLPLFVQRALFRLLVYLTRGNQRRYGFPVPDYPLGAEHPTISTELLPLIGHGRIRVKPGLLRLEGRQVRFIDDSTEEIDLIIYATGYRVAFPFFESAFLEVRENYLPRYLHVVPPDHPHLYFIGLVQPLGSIMPLAEAQAEWVADLLEGRAGLPSREAMWRWIRREEAWRRRRFVPTMRHALEVDFYRYLRQLRRERRRGRYRPPLQALLR